MKRLSSFFTINDLMHAVVIGGALALSVLGLADELYSLRSERVLALATYTVGVAAIAYPSVAVVRAALTRRRRKLATISL